MQIVFLQLPLKSQDNHQIRIIKNNDNAPTVASKALPLSPQLPNGKFQKESAKSIIAFLSGVVNKILK